MVQMTSTEFAATIRYHWSRATAYDPANWDELNPAYGQCLATALIARDIFGGAIVKGEINGIEHYWNYIGDSYEGEVDFTREQFGAGPHSTKVVAATHFRESSTQPPFQFDLPLLNTEDLWSEDLERRYKLLRERLAFSLLYIRADMFHANGFLHPRPSHLEVQHADKKEK